MVLPIGIYDYDIIHSWIVITVIISGVCEICISESSPSFSVHIELFLILLLADLYIYILKTSCTSTI